MTALMNRLAVLILAGAAIAHAQTPPGPGGGGGGMGGGPPGAGLDAVKSQLRVSDEEWKMISPALRQVVAARRNAEGSLVGGSVNPRGMRGGRGGPPGGMGNDSFDGPGGPGGFGGPGGRRGPGGPPMNDAGPNDAPPPGRRGAPGENRPGENRPRPDGDAGDAPRSGQPPRPNDRGEPNGPPDGPPGGFGSGPAAAAMNELRTLAADPTAQSDPLTAKLAVVRAERQKARANLATAVAELKALISPQQEALLVALGYLE